MVKAQKRYIRRCVFVSKQGDTPKDVNIVWLHIKQNAIYKFYFGFTYIYRIDTKKLKKIN